MTTFGDRLIESATEAVTMVKLMRENKELKDRANRLERALHEIMVQDDIGDMMYSKEGPCAIIARVALEGKK